MLHQNLFMRNLAGRRGQACTSAERSWAASSGSARAAAVRASPSRRPALAVTVDDFGLADTPLLTGAERDARIRSILARHRIKAAGFVAAKYVKGPVADEVLGAWSREGHVIGNHSFSHGYYGAGDPDAYMADILKCEALLSPYPGFRKLFRFPFLAEGKNGGGARCASAAVARRRLQQWACHDRHQRLGH